MIHGVALGDSAMVASTRECRGGWRPSPRINTLAMAVVGCIQDTYIRRSEDESSV
jgi:hypothetical protein